MFKKIGLYLEYVKVATVSALNAVGSIDIEADDASCKFVSNALDGMGYKGIKFDKVITAGDTLSLRVNLEHLPRRISLVDLSKQSVADELSLRLQRKIIIRSSAENGFWLILGKEQ